MNSDSVRRAWLVVVLPLLLGACGPPSAWSGLSPDHRRRFTVESDGPLSCLRYEGTSEAHCYEGMAVSRIVFSPDSRHVAYPVRQVDRWFVVRDDRFGPALDGVGEMVFSPDSRTLAYTAQIEDRWHIVVDDVVGRPLDSIVAGSLEFSPTGKRLAATAFVGDGMAVVVDGGIGPVHARVSGLTFGPGGRVAWVGRTEDGTSRLYVDGLAGPPYPGIEALALSSTSSAYVTREADGVRVRSGARAWGPYPDVTALRFRPGSDELFWVVDEGDADRLYVGGSARTAHEIVDPPSFSADGSRWGYTAHDSTGSAVFVDGALLDERGWIGNLVFSPDGARYAYLTRSTDAEHVVDDRGIHTFDMIVEGTLQFLEDGRWACLAGELNDRELYVVAEGVEGRRAFEWSDLAGVADRGQPVGAIEQAGLEALQAWVRAEARLMRRNVESPR